MRDLLWSQTALRELAEWGAGPRVRLNMVLGPEGQMVDQLGESQGLSSSRDRLLLRKIREDADSLIVGGASIRAEGWHPLAKGRTVVLSQHPEDLPEPTFTRHTDLVELPELTSSTLAELSDALFREGSERRLCEGGPTLAGLLGVSGRVTDVNLTIGGTDAMDAVGICLQALPFLENFVQTHVVSDSDNQTLFLRWRCATLPETPLGTSLSA